MTQPAILCIDDEKFILASLGEQLQRQLGQEYVIELACDGTDALELLGELKAEGVPVPLIISDQSMPGLSGDQVLIQARQIFPEALTILLTGQHSEEAVRNAINQASLYRYIAKPWDETDLLLTVQEALRSSQKSYLLQAQQQRLQQANQQLSHSLSILQATLDATADAILVLDQSGEISHFNQKLLILFDLIDCNCQVCLNDPHAAAPQLALPQCKLDEAKNCFTQLSVQEQLPILKAKLQSNPRLWAILAQQEEVKSNQPIEIQTEKLKKTLECYSQSQWSMGQMTGRVWSFSDVTLRKENEAFIEHQAYHDDLTGLANRVRFDQYLEQQLELAHQSQKNLAVLFIDLDHFKLINDTLGHQVGDGLLLQVVEQLNQCSRDGDLIARWGGDEFTFIAPGIPSADNACAIAERILKCLKTNFEVEGHSIHITASVGVALYPEDGDTAELLLKNADAALYQAKGRGRNCYARFNSQLGDVAEQSFIIETALHGILERQELSAHYQPQWDTQTQRITHVEALARWSLPQRGWIPTEQFIHRAEENGMIVPIGEWVLQQACLQARAWQQQGKTITMSVNLSPRQLQSPQFVARVAEILDQTQVAPQQLEFEITESVALDNLELSCERLAALRAMGIGIALDDFGTGYASLSHLKKLPLDTIKLDRYFIQDLPNQVDDEAIVQAIISLAKLMDLRLVAEGVETQALAEQLQAMGCRYLQGYWFSKPLMAEELNDLL